MIDPEIEYVEDCDNEYACRRLWSSVILMAITDYYSAANKSSAEIWLFSGGAELNGFIHLCEMLGFDAPNLRKTILRCNSISEYRKLMSRS